MDIDQIKKQLISPNAQLRKKALDQLKNMSNDKALEVLVSALGNKNIDVESDIKKAILSYKDESLPLLVKALKDPEWRVRKSAANVIASLGDSSWSKLLEIIPHNEEDIDYWMVQISSLMQGEALHYLIKAFAHPNPKIKLAAVRAAGNTKDLTIAKALINMLDAKPWIVRKAAFDSLRKMLDIASDILLDSFKKASQDAKYWIVQLLAEKRDPKLIPTFIEIIDKESEEIKLEAIKAISFIETKDAQKTLINYLAHKSWIIRKTAAEYLWEHGGLIADELLEAISNPNADVRYWSVKLLGHTHTPKVFPAILKCLNDENISVRVAACQALGTLGDSRALAPLMSLLNDKEEEVRTAALLAISQIGEKKSTISNTPSIPPHLAPENQIKCPKCSKEVYKNFTFCPFCLSHLKNVCKKCNTPIQKDWKGCPNCGEPVS